MNSMMSLPSFEPGATRETSYANRQADGPTVVKRFLITDVSGGHGGSGARARPPRGRTLRDENQRRAFEALALGRSFGRLLDLTETAGSSRWCGPSVSRKLIPASIAWRINVRLASSSSDQAGWPREGSPKPMQPMRTGDTSRPERPLRQGSTGQGAARADAGLLDALIGVLCCRGGTAASSEST